MKNLKKSLSKKIALLSLTFGGLLVLSGCVALDPKTHEPTGQGIVYNVLVRPMSSFVDLFANTFHLGYGLAIIIVTLIVRFAILPLGLRQAYKSTYMQEKTAYLQPVFAPINERLKAARAARDQTAMMAAQQELMKAQKDNGINMLSSIGCLPLIIQWPFFMALYYAARYTPGIPSSKFIGISLGNPSLILTIVAGVFYLAQSWIAMIGMPEEQKKQSQMMLWMSPVMIIIFSFMSPAGVTLYWVVGGLVIVIQQLIITFIMKPQMKVRIDQEFKDNPPKMSDLPKDVTPHQAETTGEKALDNPILSSNDRPKKNRNAGKQKRS